MEWINQIETENETGMISYLDFVYEEKKPEDDISQIGLELKNKPYELVEEYEDEYTLDKRYFSFAMEAGFKNHNESEELKTLKTFEINEKDETTIKARKLLQKILLASNLIAIGCRRGQANFVIVSSKIANILDFYEIPVSLKIIVREDIQDDNILVVRKQHEIMEPGLLLIRSKDKFKIITLGEFYHKNYVLLRIKN